MKAIALVCFLSFLHSLSEAQLFIPTGGNHPELHWNELHTEHFILIYHDGLDSTALKAAPVAEEAYRVVTTNLSTQLDKKVKIYFSDYDEIKNAFAFGDNYIFIWMRGILDDLPYGFRSSGTSKWLRSVITHEFTHIVVAHATKDIFSFFTTQTSVPRWFNEGLARFMEPDGWTSDLDAILRVATVSGHLDLGGTDDYLAGGLTYEGGQSFVRYIATAYGDSVLVKILKHRTGIFYDFFDAFPAVTGKSLGELREEWYKTLNVYYNTTYGQKEETSDFARMIRTGLAINLAARAEPGGNRIALMGNKTKISPSRLYILPKSGEAQILSDEPGFEPVFSWYPGREAICISKYHIGSSGNMVHDLYSIDIPSGELTRLTNDGRYEQPDVALQENKIVAVKTELNHSDLFILDADGAHPKQLTHYDDANTQVYSPRWSGDGKKVTYSVFRSNGMRDIAVIDVKTQKSTLITNDSANDRSSIFSPDGKEIVYLSHRNGIPNCYRSPINSSASSSATQMSDVAGAIFPWDWSGAKDSVLVTSYDGRNLVRLYWISTNREVKNVDVQPMKSRYLDWRLVHLPLGTRTYDSIPNTVIIDISSYNSLMHVRPIAILPIFSSDKGSDGSSGTRYGLFGVAFDPMEKHALTAMIDWGDASNEFGGFFSYTNRQLHQNITISGTHTYGFSRTLANVPVYQRDQSIALNISQVFSAPNSLATSHLVSLSAASRFLDPVNLQEFKDSNALRPIHFKGIDLTLRYIFLSKDLDLGAELTHANSKLGSDLTYSRFKLNFMYNIPFDDDRKVMLGFRGVGVAQFGAQIPQEYVGFTTDEVFEKGFNPLSLQFNYRLRGIRRAAFGDRLALASGELIFPDFLFGSLVPIISSFAPSLVVFYDIGSVWYNRNPTNYANVETRSVSKTTWLQSSGLELRAGLEGVFTAAVGVGWELRRHPPSDWYFRATTYF